MGMTYVKCDSLGAVAQAFANVEVELGLGIDEAARIIGVGMQVYVDSVFIPDNVPAGFACYSFDPEDTQPSGDDDEQFAATMVACSAPAASTGAQKQSEVTFFDFSGMNLVTTRNLSFILSALLGSCAAQGKVYFERFKPSKDDLVQLIATRR